MPLDCEDTSLMILTPAYGNLFYGGYVKSLMDTYRQCMVEGVPLHFFPIGNESLITRGRNRCIAFFMASDFTHALFIDADVSWDPDDIGRMIAHDKDVIAGAYPKKQYPIQYVVNAVAGKAELPEDHVFDRKNGLIEVDETGTGFMLIKRSVIEKMQEAHPELKCNSDIFPHMDGDPEFLEKCELNYYALFDTAIRESRYLSEDYEFCRKWKDLGGTIYIDTQTQLDHTGTHTFEGDISKILEKV